MKKLSYLFISSMIASPFALAVDWSYNPDAVEENTKDELSIEYGTNSIDTTLGELNITGNLRIYSGNISITGENDLVIGGTFSTLYGTTTLMDANLSVADSIIGQYNATIAIEGAVNETGNVDKKLAVAIGNKVKFGSRCLIKYGQNNHNVLECPNKPC